MIRSSHLMRSFIRNGYLLQISLIIFIHNFDEDPPAEINRYFKKIKVKLILLLNKIFRVTEKHTIKTRSFNKKKTLRTFTDQLII